MSTQTQTPAGLAGNPHHDRVAFDIESTILSRDESGTQTIESLLMDNARATLALAYEQRTANLIALFGEGFAGTGLPYGDLSKQIKERLGL